MEPMQPPPDPPLCMTCVNSEFSLQPQCLHSMYSVAYHLGLDPDPNGPTQPQ